MTYNTHWAHNVVATLNQRQWRWFNVATTSWAQWAGSCKAVMNIFRASMSFEVLIVQRDTWLTFGGLFLPGMLIGLPNVFKLSEDAYYYRSCCSCAIIKRLLYVHCCVVNEMKWNESGFRPPLCTYRLNWARRTSWGWWDDWDDTVLQTQDSKFEPWRSEAEHATSRSRRLPTILTFTRGWGTAETGNRTPNSGVKGSGANHYPRAPALAEWYYKESFNNWILSVIPYSKQVFFRKL